MTQLGRLTFLAKINIFYMHPLTKFRYFHYFIAIFSLLALDNKSFKMRKYEINYTEIIS